MKDKIGNQFKSAAEGIRARSELVGTNTATLASVFLGAAIGLPLLLPVAVLALGVMKPQLFAGVGNAVAYGLEKTGSLVLDYKAPPKLEK